jgi:hypothetical protein
MGGSGEDMHRRVGLVSVVSFSLLLVAMSSAVLSVRVVEGNDGNGVYIRADGSVDPPTAPISTVAMLPTFRLATSQVTLMGLRLGGWAQRALEI